MTKISVSNYFQQDGLICSSSSSSTLSLTAGKNKAELKLPITEARTFQWSKQWVM